MRPMYEVFGLPTYLIIATQARPDRDLPFLVSTAKGGLADFVSCTWCALCSFPAKYWSEHMQKYMPPSNLHVSRSGLLHEHLGPSR